MHISSAKPRLRLPRCRRRGSEEETTIRRTAIVYAAEKREISNSLINLGLVPELDRDSRCLDKIGYLQAANGFCG